MERIIKNTDQLGLGAFVLNKDRQPDAPLQTEGTIFLTRENNNSLKKEILRLITEATNVLKICSFIITDEELFNAILNKAQNSNTAIFLLTQLDQNKLTNSFSLLDYLTEEEIKENSVQIHLKYIKKLYDSGVHVRASVSAHAKFIVADRVTGFITSANLTTPSLTLNVESGVYLDAEAGKELDRLFDTIFQLGSGYRQFISSAKKNKILVIQSEVKKIDKSILPSPEHSGLRYTYDNQTYNLYEEIISIINTASEYVYISTYSIVQMVELEQLSSAIQSARDRGVRINIFCRAMNYRNDHLAGAQKLHSNGCKIYGDLFNHSKGAISEQKGILFTANIDGSHGLKNGFEVGYVLQEQQRKDFLSLHKSLIQSSYFVFQDTPSRADLFHSYSLYESLKNIKSPDFVNEIILTIGKGVKVNETELTSLPLFYGKDKREEYIIVGNSYYKCKLFNNTFTLTQKEEPIFNLERYILQYVNLKIILT